MLPGGFSLPSFLWLAGQIQRLQQSKVNVLLLLHLPGTACLPACLPLPPANDPQLELNCENSASRAFNALLSSSSSSSSTLRFCDAWKFAILCTLFLLSPSSVQNVLDRSVVLFYQPQNLAAAYLSVWFWFWLCVGRSLRLLSSFYNIIIEQETCVLL